MTCVHKDLVGADSDSKGRLHEWPSLSMQRVEHLAAQWIASLRVQKSENAPFLPSENRIFRPSRACVFVSANAFLPFACGLEA